MYSYVLHNSQVRILLLHNQVVNSFISSHKLLINESFIYLNIQSFKTFDDYNLSQLRIFSFCPITNR